MRLLLLLCMTWTVFSSCEKDEFDRLGDRLEGTWAFTEARQRITDKPFSSFYSIYSYYDGDEMTFYKDETLVYVEANGDIWDGEWSYYAVSSGEDKAYVLSVVLTNSRGTVKNEVWHTNGLGQPNRLSLRSEDKDYENRFVLWRQ